MIKNTTRTQKACWVVFVFYLVGLTYFTFFAEALGRGSLAGEEAVARFNLIPFLEIRRFWVYRHQLGAAAVILNLAGNVVAFMAFSSAFSSNVPSWPSGWAALTWTI